MTRRSPYRPRLLSFYAEEFIATIGIVLIMAVLAFAPVIWGAL